MEKLLGLWLKPWKYTKLVCPAKLIPTGFVGFRKKIVEN
jgi:hypothetical protein